LGLLENDGLGGCLGGITAGWRKFHSEEFHDLYFLPNIITQIKARGLR
jgi:hypothetical protein